MRACRLLRVYWILGASVLPISASADEGPQQKQTLVTISKETTVVTEPLDEDGYVDFLAAVNERLSEGVTPDNNAAVPLRIAMGLSELGEDSPSREQFDKMLGIQPVGDGMFVPLADIAQDVNIGANEAYDRLSAAHERPWTAEENPVIAGWLEANEPALEMITAATQCPRFYAPYVAAGDAAPQLIAVLLPMLQDSREAARALVARALLHAGEGDFDKAFDDLEATHRLARLIGQDPTLIGGLVAIAIDSIVCHADLALIATREHPPERLASYLHRLDQLPPLPDMGHRVDFVERLMFVDVVVSLARGSVDPEMLFGGAPALGGGAGGLRLLEKIPEFVKGTIDWDTMLRAGHSWYDRIAAAMALQTYAERSAALDAIDADIRSLAEGVHSPLQIAAIALSDNETRGELLGKQIGNSLIALLTPATQAASTAEFRGKVKFDMVRVAVALEMHRATTGEYPDSLAPLTKGAFQQVPPDRFSGRPLLYQRRSNGERREDGYLLYSVGPNVNDDAATSYISSTRKGEHVSEQTVDATEGDDLVIRVPLPE